MTLNELVQKVQTAIQDPSFSEAQITGYINRGLFEVAGAVQLPELYKFESITTDVDNPFTALPSDFMRDVVFIHSQKNGGRLTVEVSHIKFLKLYPGLDRTGGGIARASVKGSMLFYQPVPSTPDTLTVHYHRKPDMLAEGSDEPDCLPAHLQEALLVSFAAWKIFSLIEDGIEGPKVNTDRYDRDFHLALADLKVFLGDEDGEPVFVSDDIEDIEIW